MKTLELSPEAIDLLHSEYDAKDVSEVQQNCYPDESIEDVITVLNFLADEQNFDGTNPEVIFFAGIKYAKEKFKKLLQQQKKFSITSALKKGEVKTFIILDNLSEDLEK